MGALTRYPPSAHLEHAVYAHAMHLGKAVWSARRAILHPHPRDTLSAAQIGTAAAVLLAVSALALAPLCLLTFRQIATWRDSLSIWRHAVDVTANNRIAEENFGFEPRGREEYDEAVVHLRNAARIDPNHPVLHLNLAATLAASGHLEEAVSEYEATVRLSGDPKLTALADADPGTAYRRLGRRALALEHYERAPEADATGARAAGALPAPSN